MTSTIKANRLEALYARRATTCGHGKRAAIDAEIEALQEKEYYVVAFRSPGGSDAEMYVWETSPEKAREAGAYVYEGWSHVSTELVK